MDRVINEPTRSPDHTAEESVPILHWWLTLERDFEPEESARLVFLKWLQHRGAFRAQSTTV